MSSISLSSVTSELVESYGNTVHNVISAYRAGGERVADFLDTRWDRAFAESRDQLSAEVRKNAQAAHDLFNGYYLKGIALTSDGADAVVNKVVALAGEGIKRVAANADRLQSQTGLSALSQVAQASVPVAVAVHKLASALEQKSVQLANQFAGDKARIKLAATKRVSAFKKARTRKAA